MLQIWSKINFQTASAPHALIKLYWTLYLKTWEPLWKILKEPLSLLHKWKIKLYCFWNCHSGQTHWSWHFFLGFAIFAWAISFLLETRRWNCVSMTKLSTFLPAQNLNILVLHPNPAWLKLKLCTKVLGLSMY